MDILKVAVCEMTSSDSWQKNQVDILGKLESLPEGTELVSFPENSLYMRLREGEKIPAVELDDPIFVPLSVAAKEKKLWIHLGSVPLLLGGKIQNATVMIDPDGRRTTPYQKLHLFDVEITGHKSYRESDQFLHGTNPAIIDVKGWRIGLTICYDLRFSELYNYYAQKEVDVIVVPSAFTVPTGQAHWEILLRARAIESQCYVLAAAQGGLHGPKRETYGHSMIVDPWGKILKEATVDHDVIAATLFRTEIEKVRTQIPMRNHRKNRQVYQ